MDNSKIKECIKKRQAFKSAGSEAYYIGKEYIVKSYKTIIFSDSEGLSLLKYSTTTSKLQKIISEAFYGVNFLKCKRVKAIEGKDYIKV